MDVRVVQVDAGGGPDSAASVGLAVDDGVPTTVVADPTPAAPNPPRPRWRWQS
jgi:hypothetical protein